MGACVCAAPSFPRGLCKYHCNSYNSSSHHYVRSGWYHSCSTCNVVTECFVVAYFVCEVMGIFVRAVVVA